MKYVELEDYIKNLNTFFNDEELNKLHERLRYPISNMTTKEKFNYGLEAFEDIHQQYIERLQEIVSNKFNAKIKELEQFK